jgi:aarF domain-containing kinase
MLDHGLYREISDEFRVHYCHLWRALILGDGEEIKRHCMAMNVGAMPELFAAMLTHKPWDVISAGPSDLNRLKVQTKRQTHSKPLQPQTMVVDPVVQNYALHYKNEIADILSRLPRPLLLLLKTNDCLRSVDFALGSPVNQFTIMARYCLRGIEQYYRRPASMVSSWDLWFYTAPVYVRLWIFEWITWFQRRPTLAAL